MSTSAWTRSRFRGSRGMSRDSLGDPQPARHLGGQGGLRREGSVLGRVVCGELQGVRRPGTGRSRCGRTNGKVVRRPAGESRRLSSLGGIAPRLAAAEDATNTTGAAAHGHVGVVNTRRYDDPYGLSGALMLQHAWKERFDVRVGAVAATRLLPVGDRVRGAELLFRGSRRRTC